MERLLIEKLVAWKHSPTRKPLVLDGARQVGKTWLLKQFGATEYKNCVYVNCDHNPLMDSLFSDYDIKRILLTLSAQTNQQIIPGETLVIFDEIQESPIALTAMKYFCSLTIFLKYFSASSTEPASAYGATISLRASSLSGPESFGDIPLNRAIIPRGRAFPCFQDPLSS